jgi:hypothetical protein
LGDRRADQRWVAEGGKRDEPDAVPVLLDKLGRSLQG